MNLPHITSWSDIGAIAQSITAIVSIAIAWFAFRYSHQQTAINSSIAINNAWNEINRFSMQNPASRAAFNILGPPISSHIDPIVFDQVVFMHINVQEMYYYLYKNGVIKKNQYKPIMDGAGLMLSSVPNLKMYLERGYDKEFASSMIESVSRFENNLKIGS